MTGFLLFMTEAWCGATIGIIAMGLARVVAARADRDVEIFHSKRTVAQAGMAKPATAVREPV